MQRISVDLPEPDGPQITMRSPLATLSWMSRSTWNWPYHLLTSRSNDRDRSVVGSARLADAGG